jgi:hypothetical protein
VAGADPVTKLAGAHGGLSTQAQSAFHAIRGFGEQVALGVSPTQALTAQMNHLSYAASGEGGITGAFSQVASKAGGAIATIGAFVTPLAIAGTAMAAFSAGAIAAAANWQSAQDDIGKALVGIGRQSGITVADINAIGVATSATTKLSIGQATELATSFAALGKIPKESIGPATAATQALAKALGVDAPDAAKLLAGALTGDAKGIDDLNSKTGALNSSMREQVAQALRMGDVGMANALIIRGTIVATQDATKANESWTDSFSDLWKNIKNGANLLGGDVVKGAQQFRHDFGGARQTAGVSTQGQLNQAQGELSNLQSIDPANYDRAAGGAEAVKQKIASLTAEIEKLKQQKLGENIASWNAELDKIAPATNASTQAMLPQIAKLKEIDGVISDLTRARNFQILGNQSTADVDAALVVAQNLKQAISEAKEQTIQQNAAVQEVAQSYQGLNQSTAVALETSKNQLPVIQAVGADEKMAAQYAADLANAWLKGVPAADAMALAADRLKNSSAAAVASAIQQTQSLKDRNDLAAAGNGLGQISALQAQQSLAGQQAYNQVMRDTGAELTAQLAGQQAYNDELQKTGDLEKAIEAGNKAYVDSIQNGTAAQAATNKQYEVTRGYQQQINQLQQQAAASALQWQQNMLGVSAAAQQAAAASVQAASALEQAARAAQGAALGAGGDFGSFDVAKGTQYTSSTGKPYQSPNNPLLYPPMDNHLPQSIDNAYAKGGFDAAVTAAVRGTSAVSDIGALYNLKNSQTTDKTAQAANIQQEIALLQSLPETIARDQKIADLTNSINSLTSSTSTLNSTMQDALSPYYSQDPRTSHIGFRSQGMATGGEFTVPGGYSANDNMIGQIPLASGEIVSVRRPGESSGGSATKSQSITINMPVTIQSNASKNDIGRTMFQVGQSMAKQLAASK